MEKTERELIRRLVKDFTEWSRRAAAVRSRHDTVRAAATSGEQELRSRVVSIASATRTAWRVMPLEPSDVALVRQLAERAALPAPTAADRTLIRLLAEDIQRPLAEARFALGIRRFFTGSTRKQAARVAGEFLRRQHAALTKADGLARLDRLGASATPVDPARVGFDALLDPALGFDLHSRRSGPEPEILDRPTFAGLPEALDTIATARSNEASYRAAAQEAAERVRQAEVRRILAAMPVETLKTATGERLRLGPLVEAGIRTVQAVLDRGPSLPTLPGIGETTAQRMLGAASALHRTTQDETPVRIDVDRRPPETTELLRRLAEWGARRQTTSAATELRLAAELAPLRTALSDRTARIVVIPTRSLAAGRLREHIESVKRHADLLTVAPAPGRKALRADPWPDFFARAADYFAMLAELGFLAGDEDAAHGDLPEDIIAAVRDQPLSSDYLTASLRGYQSFAARFALVQRKVVIGDEMGLGKTLEAIAVLAHLYSLGKTRFLVICPAAVVTNWVRELSSKSKLPTHRVHGPERERAAESWIRAGGVAVTTYDTLAWWESTVPAAPEVACVVVDEAHYIKNPQALRTIRTVEILARTDRAMLLTGTPLENKVEEFRSLVSYLRPDLDATAASVSPREFRRQIAPAYLRRNQEDVLTELPELIEVNEWLPMSAADAASYRAAVGQGNFMAMRQAAMLQGNKSEKIQRLVEIVGEAEENQRRVLVFSYFKAVLDLVARSLTGPVFGPLTGSVPADQRQQMVDQFSASEHGAVLVAQIVAGGVGLNIQSASVVIICEPQLKPTTEAQAIARAHRMGQVQGVQVHRLLSEDSVDQRIIELLSGKKRLFNDYARVSDMAASSPDAIDLSEADLVREVVAAERKRLAERASAND